MTGGSDAADMGRAVSALRDHWGYERFRPGQEAILQDVLAGRDVLGILPTGGGKSLCYQLPAVMEDGLTLVVSPLVALMADQVAGLTARGIPSTWLGSALSWAESEQRWNDLMAGRYRLLYVAPERLDSERFRARAGRLRIRRIAVDEAHCVSEWGHDFRPDFLNIAESRRFLGNPPLVAVTATATPPVRRDIVRLLGLRDPTVHVHGFDRPNIVWSVFTDPDKPRRVGEVLESVPGGGIVYVSTRRGVEAWTERLRRRGEPARAYHAGMNPDERRQSREEWTSGRTRVIVATSAFGMGIDRPDVRFVIHADPPASLEAYYQEAGRAGRDGRTAHAVLLVDQRDRASRVDRLGAEHPDSKTIAKVFEVACSLADIAVGSGSDTPFAVEEDRIGTLCGASRTAVRRAAELLERSGAWTRVRLPEGHGLVRIHASASDLRKWAVTAGLGELVDGLLREIPPEAWSTPQAIEPAGIGRRLGIAPQRLLDGLIRMGETGQVAWQPPQHAALYRLEGARPGRAPVDAAAVRRSKDRAVRRFGDLTAYVDAIGCRRRFLLAFFGESGPDRCGRCDTCTGRHDPYTPDPADEGRLLALLQAVADAASPDDVQGLSEVPTWRRRSMAEWLVAEGLLRHSPTGETRYEITGAGREALAGPDQGSRSAFS